MRALLQGMKKIFIYRLRLHNPNMELNERNATFLVLNVNFLNLISKINQR